MPDTIENSKTDFDKDKLDYEQTTLYFRSLHETRFRLLQFLPVITGVSVFTSTNLTNKFEMVLGALGIAFVVGITIYDQRNNMIYDRLTKRAAFLEKKMGFRQLPTDKSFGGAFWSRPKRRKLFGVPIIWHDLALGIIYSTSFGVWVYLFFDGASHKWGMGSFCRLAPTIVLTLCSFICYIRLVKLNDHDNHTIQVILENP